VFEAFILDLMAWWATVPRQFAFLMALPFVISAVALIADGLRRRH
jgi:hypothetical protein